VPVGGAIIAGFDKGFVERISKMYPGKSYLYLGNVRNSWLTIISGRASSSPALDVFITLLSLGVKGFKELVTQRKEMYTLLKEELGKVAHKHGERLLETKSNPISIGETQILVNMQFLQWCFSFSAMTLSCLAGGDPKSITMLGSMLFLRCVSGSRVITGVDVKDVHGHKFEGMIGCDF
jgi:O-phospho-L-seryl-tRNASec:L-selenocysteinyl-tRNA synthase